MTGVVVRDIVATVKTCFNSSVYGRKLKIIGPEPDDKENARDAFGSTDVAASAAADDLIKLLLFGMTRSLRDWEDPTNLKNHRIIHKCIFLKEGEAVGLARHRISSYIESTNYSWRTERWLRHSDSSEWV
jgi:hypothetical protein